VAGWQCDSGRGSREGGSLEMRAIAVSVSAAAVTMRRSCGVHRDCTDHGLKKKKKNTHALRLCFASSAAVSSVSLAVRVAATSASCCTDMRDFGSKSELAKSAKMARIAMSTPARKSRCCGFPCHAQFLLVHIIVRVVRKGYSPLSTGKDLARLRCAAAARMQMDARVGAPSVAAAIAIADPRSQQTSWAFPRRIPPVFFDRGTEAGWGALIFSTWKA
jgi:hypothetical protein